MILFESISHFFKCNIVFVFFRISYFLVLFSAVYSKCRLAGEKQIKNTHLSKKSTEKENKEKYALIRDQANDKLKVVPCHEVICSKNRKKLCVGDTITHGLRDKRIRAMIVLLGKFFQ